jgi:RNA polymerase sigma-70 factor (ECF subfamily)
MQPAEGLMMNEPAVTARGEHAWHPPPARQPGQDAGRADDAALIERSGRQPEAFAAIFERHATEIHRFAARRLGDALAEDVVGEVFLTAFRRRDSYDRGYPDARPWLYGIATNVIRRHRHTEARSYRILARTGADPVVASHDEEVLARVAASAQRRALAASLAKLHSADRDTLLLIVWGGLSYTETAHALRIPVGTVRSRLHRARRKLRAALGDTSPIELDEENQS